MHLEVVVSLASDSSKPVVSAPIILNLQEMLSGLGHLALEIQTSSNMGGFGGLAQSSGQFIRHKCAKQ